MARGPSLEPDAHPPSDPIRRRGVPAVAERTGPGVAGAAAWTEARSLRALVLSQPDGLRAVRGWSRQHELEAGIGRLSHAAVHGASHRHIAVRPLLPGLRAQRPRLPLR